MTALTNLTDAELDAILSGSVDGVHPTTQEMAMAAELKSLRTQVEKAMEQKPEVWRWMRSNGDPGAYCVTTDKGIADYWISKGNTVRPLYAEPVPQAVSILESDVLAIVGLLEDHEWAEHCTKTELGQRLEQAITELHNECGEESQPYTVPDEMAVTDEMTVTAQMFARGHNACRAAMLTEVEQVKNNTPTDDDFLENMMNAHGK